MAHSLTTIGRHLECAIQTELVVQPDIPPIRRKQSWRFVYNSVICQKDLVGWHCAKVKGRVDLKINKKKQSKDI